MNCDRAENWLLAARSLSDLPTPLRRHVSRCRRCADLLNRLERLDQTVGRLAPAANPAGRARLDARLAETPQSHHPIDLVERPREALPRADRGDRSLPRWLIAVAAVLLIVLAGVTGRLTSPPSVVLAPAHESLSAPPGPSPEAPEAGSSKPGGADVPVPGATSGLAVRAALSAVSVATNPTPIAQLHAFEELAGELRGETLRRASAGDPEPLPRLIGLHERILKLGIARQLARLAEPARTSARDRLAEALDRSADEVAHTADNLLPVVADLLRPLVVTCRETARAWRQGQGLPPPPDWPSPATPLESLVAQAIRVADAADPLTHADESAQLAVSLAQLVIVLAVAGREDDAARISEAINGVLDLGVVANLDRVTASDNTGQLHKTVTEIRERAARATEVLQRNLAKAPPPARAGLERAVKVSEVGRAKVTGQGVGKPAGTGPPWKKGDSTHPVKGTGLPPGWQKKP
jgi:hypothetical protein